MPTKNKGTAAEMGRIAHDFALTVFGRRAHAPDGERAPVTVIAVTPSKGHSAEALAPYGCPPDAAALLAVYTDVDERNAYGDPEPLPAMYHGCPVYYRRG